MDQATRLSDNPRAFKDGNLFMNSVVLVTGTTHGIGLVTARELARARYTVVMACRDLALADQVVSDIKRETGNQEVYSVSCDLASLASVRLCAETFLSRFSELHVLINNAGLMRTRRETTIDGFETTFATNHLGPFLLTNLLLDRLRESAPARIVNVASNAHRGTRLDFEDLQARRKYRAMQAYAKSKLANVMFTLALARRLEGTGVTVNCLHPGVVGTNIFPTDNFLFRAVAPIARHFLMSPQMGAKTTLHLAKSNTVVDVSGAYFDEFQKPRPPSLHATNEMDQEELWRVSEALTGITDG
ncbi:MAG: SDR family oxidoreductase [Gammaproteobacteria bacterium]|nr:SDR family oxidoreductase [Gammaproteobacteria bacterium]